MDDAWENCGFYFLSQSRLDDLRDWTQRAFYRRLELNARDLEYQILREEHMGHHWPFQKPGDQQEDLEVD